MAQIKYHYALDEHNRLVSIDQAYNEREESHTYHCIGCGAEMIPRLGKVRSYHFAHRGDENCGSETYLHKLAKLLIKEKFEKDPSFIVRYFRDIRCSDMYKCSFAKEEECHDFRLEPIDLKQYYDTCEEEQPVKDYIADLLLTNSTMPYREPVLIEIQVSHKSTQEKLDSGLHIIEIRLNSEDDIKKLLSAPYIDESPEAEYGHVRDVKTIGFAKFYGFKKEFSSSIQQEKRNIHRFYLYPNGKACVSELHDRKSCMNAWKKERVDTIFEASIDGDYFGAPSLYDFGYLAAKESGIQIKNCQLCKYHMIGYDRMNGNSPIFCCMSKKFGTPKYPKSSYAKECKYYREDRKQMDNIHKLMPPIVVASNHEK